MTNVHIIGSGAYTPLTIVTNTVLETRLNLEPEWIKRRTGIEQRHVARDDETNAYMATAATQEALRQASIDTAELDLILVATLTPDYVIPATACQVQDALGSRQAGAGDVNSGCAGFMYAFNLAAGMIKSQIVKTVTVIGSERMTDIVNQDDRQTAPLFGDGAGAVVLQGSDKPGGVLASRLQADGSKAKYLEVSPNSKMIMDGKRVYRAAVDILVSEIQHICRQGQVELSEIDLVIAHQANIRIIQKAADRLQLSGDRFYTNISDYGNTSSASIPIALHEVRQTGRIKDGDKIILVGFGGGMTWGSALIDWSENV